MDIVKLTDKNAIEKMRTRVERALDDPQVRVFQIFGRFGIGKRTAIHALFHDRGILPVEHNYTIIETGKPVVDKVVAYPHAIHLWDDVFHSNIMHPEVLSAFQKIQDGTIEFNGTFLLVANDHEFPNYEFPPFPGVHIEFAEITVLLEHLEPQMRSKGHSEGAIYHRLQSAVLSTKNDRTNEDR